jgi:DNA polymerase I-like protein with 3'-5' exonuclease and polymerase domains
VIDFDVETTGLQPYSGKHHAFSYQFYDGQEAVYFEYDHEDPDPEVHAEIQRWFDRAQNDEDGIRAWNSKFDWSFAEQAGFRVPTGDKWHDGMIVAHAIDERRSVALKAVARQLFGEGADALQKDVKDWLNAENRRRRKLTKDAAKSNATPEMKAEAAQYEFEGDLVYANFSDVPNEIMEPYGLEDVLLTRRVCDAFDTVLDNQPSLRQVVEFERGTMAALYDIEKRGLPADANGYRRLELEVLQNLERLEDRVAALAKEGDPVVYAKELAGKEWGGEDGAFVEVDETGRITAYTGGAKMLDDFNPKSTTQILAALKARGADMSYMSEKNGSLSADAENLRAVDDELAVAILNFRSEFKVLSTYVRPMIGRTYEARLNSHKEPFIAPDGRIHTTYRQVGARTGRMSSADPNVQNQPRDDLRLRYNVVAGPGNVLVCCDLTNIEMVLFAAYCGEGRLLDAVRAGTDLHVLTAQMLGLRDRARPGGGIETARQLGKTYNFSRIYGGGLRTIKRSFRCSMDQARILKRRFDDAYPEVGRLQNRIDYSLSDNGYIQDKLISGRRFRVDERESYKATNYLVQGTAAALLKYAVMQLYKDGVPMVALVHDEIVAEVPIGDAIEAAKLIETRMTEFEGLKGIVPLRAEADIVQHWSDAKPLKDESGRPYFFTPKWVGEDRLRYVDEQPQLVPGWGE